MKWLNSLDELLYEVMSWLLFFPMTLWRATFLPLDAMAGIEREAALPDDQQYAATLSPPLFLSLALLLAHLFGAALGQTDAIIANHHGLADLVNDNASALILRVTIFAAFPLFLAARAVRRSGRRLDRKSLQLPFYAQCYPAAVFALGLSIGTSLVLDHHQASRIAGQILIAISFVNFGAVEIRWFARTLDIGYVRAFRDVTIGFVEGVAFLACVGFLFTR